MDTRLKYYVDEDTNAKTALYKLRFRRYADEKPKDEQKCLLVIDDEWQVAVFYTRRKGSPVWMVNNETSHRVAKHSDVWSHLPYEGDISCLFS